MKFMRLTMPALTCLFLSMQGSVEPSIWQKMWQKIWPTSQSQEEKNLASGLAVLKQMRSQEYQGSNIGLPKELQNLVYGYMKEFREVRRYQRPEKIYSVALSATDGRTIAAALDNGFVMVWQANEDGTWPAQATKAYEKSLFYADGVTLSADGQTLFARTGNHINVRHKDINGVWLNIDQMLPYSNGAVAVSLSSDAHTIVAETHDDAFGVATDDVLLWKSNEDGTWPMPLIIGLNQTGTLSADGRNVVSYRASDGTIRVFQEGENGLWKTQVRPTLQAKEAGVRLLDLALSSDAQTILAGFEDNDIKIWHDVDEYSNMWPLTEYGAWPTPLILQGHTAKLTSLALSANGRTAIAGYDDGIIKVWQTDVNGAFLARATQTLKGQAAINSLAISADGRTFVSGDEDGNVSVWQFGPTTAIEAIKNEA